jgi:hypothetical protein
VSIIFIETKNEQPLLSEESLKPGRQIMLKPMLGALTDAAFSITNLALTTLDILN